MKRLLVLFITLAILAASFPPQAVAAQASCGRTYTVQKGDYLSKIARQCGVTTTALLQANPSISDWNLIYPARCSTSLSRAIRCLPPSRAAPPTSSSRVTRSAASPAASR